MQTPTEHYEAAMVIKHEFTELHTKEKTLLFSMFSRNDHPKACKLIRFTRKEDKAGEVALPKCASPLKRPSLRLIDFERQNSIALADKLWKNTPVIREVRPQNSKYQFMYGFIDDYDETV